MIRDEAKFTEPLRRSSVWLDMEKATKLILNYMSVLY